MLENWKRTSNVSEIIEVDEFQITANPYENIC